MHKKYLLSFLITFFLVSACNTNENQSLLSYDQGINLSRSDFKEQLINPEKRNISNVEDTIPELSPVLSIPQKPTLAQGELVSLKVTENVPLKDLFIELSRIAKIEIEIDPNITGGVILIVNERPFMDVVEQICDSANLRYSIKNGVLKVERDLPYTKNYSLPYINSTRDYTSSIDITNKIGEDTLSSGGSSSLAISSKGDLWTQIIENLEQIVGRSEDSDEYIIHNQKSSIITVSTTEKKQKYVKAYLDKVKKDAFAQVLIEAKIVEVELKDEYHTGINWSSIGGLDTTDGLSSGSLAGSTNAGLNFISIPFRKNKGSDFQGALNFIESFGTTRTLSSPRLTATNNQQAILTFTENKVYFEVDYESDTTAATTGTSEAITNTTISSEQKSVSVGIVLSLQPSINLDKQEILMNIRPTISSSNETVADPGIEFIRAEVAKSSGDSNLSVTNQVPIVKIQELDTLLKAKSGQVMVIGGLIEQMHKNQEKGVPFLKNIPLIGNAFKAKDREIVLTETVIFIRTTIIGTNNPVNNSDKNFYNKFTNDPNRLKF